ncbi:putative olfactory receptor 10J6 [Spea bombifrons]|uniref:putative olfactory receptor 10J6 n=1 Tax=Spea bombifrons TaxID=233779 RepID=UPI00234957E2|nr:putative olfactory receptor 10J6 [Spea bombifrons]
MGMETLKNRTKFEEFWILGFENAYNLTILLFLLFLVVYIVTVSANFMIVLLVYSSHHIYSPMYFFLSHLSLNDILLTTNIVPKMLSVELREGSAMTIAGCFTQLYFFQISAVVECLLLTVMSYDRYLAICNPLRYSSIMDLKLCEMFKNGTKTIQVDEFWILGFKNIHNFRILLFLLFLITYVMTVSANFVIVLLVYSSHHVYSPMYFFLSHLSLNDILLITNIVPKMLSVELREGDAMSITGCFTQFYFFEISTTVECLLLTVMSYDRYLAICKPLRYSSIMDLNLCIFLVTLTWDLDDKMKEWCRRSTHGCLFDFKNVIPLKVTLHVEWNECSTTDMEARLIAQRASTRE